jgi:hypothetical protein
MLGRARPKSIKATRDAGHIAECNLKSVIFKKIHDGAAARLRDVDIEDLDVTSNENSHSPPPEHSHGFSSRNISKDLTKTFFVLAAMYLLDRRRDDCLPEVLPAICASSFERRNRSLCCSRYFLEKNAGRRAIMRKKFLHDLSASLGN